MVEAPASNKVTDPKPEPSFLEIAKEEVANTTVAFFAPFTGAVQVIRGLVEQDRSGRRLKPD